MSAEEEIHEALETLGLPPMVTREEIKKRYRRLAKQFHPDRRGGEAGEMEAINRAYETLMAYVENFRFRFDEEEIARQYPETRHSEQFKP
jgi:curved DNA-binding protein CbpA